MNNEFEGALYSSVNKGEQIGEVGNTGASTGPHLHIEIRDDNNTAYDPSVFFN